MSHNRPQVSEEVIAHQFQQGIQNGVGKSNKHESAALHVSGEAQYIDDRLELPGMLHLCPRLSEHAHARIISIDVAPCYAVPGVVSVLTWRDVPGDAGYRAAGAWRSAAGAGGGGVRRTDGAGGGSRKRAGGASGGDAGKN